MFQGFFSNISIDLELIMWKYNENDDVFDTDLKDTVWITAEISQLITQNELAAGLIIAESVVFQKHQTGVSCCSIFNHLLIVCVLHKCRFWSLFQTSFCHHPLMLCS